MNLKSILFAGAGLFIAMTAMVIFMKGDVQRMKDEAAAKRASECAAQTTPAPTAGGAAVIDPTTGLPVAAASTPAAGAADPDCAADASQGQATQETTQQPITDPTMDAQQAQQQYVDPAVQSQQQYDQAAAPIDPSMAGQPVEPIGGM